MNKPAGSMAKEHLIEQVREQLNKGAVVRAMQILSELHQREPDSVDVLSQLADLNLHLEMFDHAIVNLQKLTILEPEQPRHFDQLAGVYGGVRDYDRACEVYYTLLARKPRSPEAHFNLAYYLRKAGRFEDSIENYKRALSLGIDHPEEAHLNIAVILADDLRKEDQAEKRLLEALAVNQHYLPALYNLANLYEDRGDRKRTVALFEQILSIDPDHAKALSRLAAMKNVDNLQDPLVGRLSKVSQSHSISLSDKIDAFYSLGKVHNDCAAYDQAFHHYTVANELNALEMQPYDPAASEAYFEQIMGCVSADWIRRNVRDSGESPIFICGMFRSGSTLVEQILAAHPLVTAGGERDSFVRELSQPKMKYPAALEGMEKRDLDRMARRYSAQSEKLFPGTRYLTDKRPDNFLYLGLLKALFPESKIIYTTRQPLDNCLSVYFVRLGQAMNYAVNLDNIAHYYDQQTRLLGHWKAIFGDGIHLVEYEAMISDPRRTVEEMLNYLGLDWDDRCLEFHQLGNTVKTASVWQVRQPLYTMSSGRWRNYEKHIGNLIARYGSMAER